MDKPFKTYRQMLSLLRSRNLSIPDGSKAIKILKNNSYYNVINGYKDVFIDKALTQKYGDDRYKNGTEFDHIFSLYNFDREVSIILFKYLLIVEAAIKAKIAYVFSEAHKQNFNYLDINNFDSGKPKDVTKLISDLSSIITRNTKNSVQGGQFYHYLDRYKELPLWVLCTKMPLGNIIYFFHSLNQTDKERVIKDIVESYEKQYKVKVTTPLQQQALFVSNMLDFINVFRNTCAHQERLYNLVYKNQSKSLNIAHFHQTKPITFSSKLFDCIIVLGLFLPKKDYQAFVRAVGLEIKNLEKKLPQALFNQVLILMGFSKKWEQELKLP